MASIKTEINFTEILKMVSEDNQAAMWNYVSKRLKAEVKRLMNSGIDVHGKNYKAYSVAYAKLRSNSKNKLSTKVNLQFSSQMYLSIMARNSSVNFEVFLTGKDANEKAEWVSIEREFLAWGKRTEKVLNDSIQRYFKLQGWT